MVTINDVTPDQIEAARAAVALSKISKRPVKPRTQEIANLGGPPILPDESDSLWERFLDNWMPPIIRRRYFR